jgi:formylglycine-generating enzyme required for sulfatase activity
MLEKARAGLEKARLYKAALAKLAEGCPDEACAHLLALLELDSDHAAARARLPEAAQGVLAELEEAQTELEKIGSENEALHARAADLEAKLAEAQATLKKLEPEAKRRAKWGDVRTHPQDGKEMVRVPVGAFLYSDEKKKIELPEFWIDKTPVTNAEYARFVAAAGHKPPRHWEGRVPPKEMADHPVVDVSWHDAVAYAGWAGKWLPTEEQWEKAARGTDGRGYPWGDWEEDRCNIKETGIRGTTAVGQYSPDGDSPFSCVDMAGNVWEWTVTEEDDRRVVRGGSWDYNQNHARCAARVGDNAILSDSSSGFRCVSPG